jgi:hypothetical protein
MALLIISKLASVNGRCREAQAKKRLSLRMHVRQKKNRSGTISVVIVSKAHSIYREVKSFGTSDSEEKVSVLLQEAENWLHSHGGQQELDFEDFKGRELEETERVIKLKGRELSVGKVLDTAKTITAIRVNMPENRKVYTKTLFLTEKHQALKPLFELEKQGK